MLKNILDLQDEPITLRCSCMYIISFRPLPMLMHNDMMPKEVTIYTHCTQCSLDKVEVTFEGLLGVHSSVPARLFEQGGQILVSCPSFDHLSTPCQIFMVYMHHAHAEVGYAHLRFSYSLFFLLLW